MVTEQARKLGEGLVAAKVITLDQLNLAIAEASMDNAPSLIVNLIQKDLLTYQIFEKFITRSLGIKSAIISDRKFDPTLIKKIGESVIKNRHIFPLAMKEQAGSMTLLLAMVDPLDTDVIDMAEKISKLKVAPVLISLPDFEQTVKKYFNSSSGGINVSSKAEAEKLVLIRPGGYEEEIAFQANKTRTAQAQKAKRISNEVELDRFSDSDNSTTTSSFLGTSDKKYREEIIVKLGLQSSDSKALQKELYTKELLYNDLMEVSHKALNASYVNLSTESKVEALANALIKLGLMTKRDLMMAAAVSSVFGESENK